MTRQVQAGLGDFEQLVLLGLVRAGDDAYGMSIAREIEQRTGRVVSLGAVYTTLDRLERKGYVRHFIGAPTDRRGGRRRKLYVLEPRGKQALGAAARAFAQMTQGLRKAIEAL